MRAARNCATPADLWGLGVSPLEDLLVARHGKDIQVCSIGPAGEMRALTACIMNDKERAAGRSGLGAVMGCKRLKCIVVRGKLKVPVFDEQKMKELRRDTLKQATGAYGVLNQYGTAGITHDAVMCGDGPVRNWGGAATVDFPTERSRRISDDAVVGLEGYKPYGCWHCPIACGGKVAQKAGRFPLALNGGIGHKPEYETLAMFGIEPAERRPGRDRQGQRDLQQPRDRHHLRGRHGRLCHRVL